MDRRAFGRFGEQKAESYLKRRGWITVARNFRDGYHEIDIVGYRFGTLAFFEVKTRSSLEYGTPAQAVDAKKTENIRKAASFLVSSYVKNGKIPVRSFGMTRMRRVRKKRIDIIEVFSGRDGKNIKINQIKDITGKGKNGIY